MQGQGEGSVRVCIYDRSTSRARCGERIQHARDERFLSRNDVEACPLCLTSLREQLRAAMREAQLSKIMRREGSDEFLLCADADAFVRGVSFSPGTGELVLGDSTFYVNDCLKLLGVEEVTA